MAKRGIRYIVKQIRQIAVLSIGLALFFGLCFASLTQAQSDQLEDHEEQGQAALPTKVMQILMVPAGSPINRCPLEEEPPAVEKCRPFFNIDNEDILKNLLQNYTRCLDGHSYYLDLSNQPAVGLSKTLDIYGRTDSPLTIRGLKLIPDESFPIDIPAIIIHGKQIILKDVHLEGFESGILFASQNNEQHQIIGGEIKGPGNGKLAIAACHASPKLEGVDISGYSEEISVIVE